MANSTRKTPWGRVRAVVAAPTKDKPDNKEWLELGPAWMNETREGKRYVHIELKVVPVQWADPHCPRELDISIESERRRGGNND